MKKIELFILLVIAPFLVFALEKGDVDGQNGVDNKDYVLVRNHILKNKLLTGEELKRADVDGQNGVDNRDYVLIRNIIVNGSSNTPTPTPTLTEEEKICESVKGNASIDYKSFVSLKKNNDDYYVIKAAHDCANKYNKPVSVTKGEYHIYKKNNDIISVQTSTNFNNSTIYIHDEYESIYNYMGEHIFKIVPNNSNACSTTTTTNFTNAFNSLVPSTGKYFVYLSEQGGTKVYNRNHCDGDKTCQEKDKRDVYRVYNGVVQDPIFWNYNNSKVEYKKCPIPSEQLVFKNGVFKTIFRVDCEKCVSSYMKRGLAIRRSNTKIYNIKHYYVNSKYENAYETHHKYNGFFAISEAGDILVEKCIVYALYYKTASGDNGSTYDMTIARGANVKLDNVKMYEDSKKQMSNMNYWSAMTTYECKNLYVVNSKFNTISAHTNVYNLTIKDSTVGVRGITVAGTGDKKDNKLIIENVKSTNADHLIKIRYDYGTTWNGTISIKNTEIANAKNSTYDVVVFPSMLQNAKPNLVFNQPIYNPTKISINGLKVNSSNVTKLEIIGETKKNINYYYLEYFQRKTNKNEEIKFSKKNITGVKTITNYAG